MDIEEIQAYCRAKPGLEVEDLFKFLYKSYFGCEHLAADYDYALERIYREVDLAGSERVSDIEDLDGDFCRVNLSVLDRGLAPETLCKIFLLSADKQEDGPLKLAKALVELPTLAREGRIPFSHEEVQRGIEEWKAKGLGPIHHSQAYRDLYHPSYRVIKKAYAKLIGLFIKIDQALKQGDLILAIEGRSGAGKTSLASLLGQIYPANIFHMDDFFLQDWQRIEERLASPGENIDHERFLEEVLRPLAKKEPVLYRPYSCRTGQIACGEKIPYKALNIIEGVYSMHSKLNPYYDLRVFLDIDSDIQAERIEKRNSPDLAQRYFNEWIPMEEGYFDKVEILSKVDMVFGQD